MSKSIENPIVDDIIDETFKGLSSPSATFDMGRKDITTDRPGAVLIDAVKNHTAAGGFSQHTPSVEEDDIITSQKNKNRMSISDLKDIHENKSENKPDMTSKDEE